MLNGESIFSYLSTHVFSFVIFFFSKLELSIPFMLSICLVAIYEKDIKTKLITMLALISISLSIFFIMFGVSTRVEMIYMLIYAYIIGLYMLNRRLSIFFEKKCLIFLIVLVLLFCCYKLMYSYLRIGVYNYVRTMQIVEFQQQGVSNPNFSSIPLDPNIYFTDLAPYSDNWFNVQFANYYGFKTAIAE